MDTGKRLNVPLRERCAAIEFLIVDVDGVLTEGGIVHGTGGLEVKTFHVRDGSGLKLWQQAGKRVGIITGRSSPVVEVRAGELGIGHVIQGAVDKLAACRQMLAENNVQAEHACCMGDDLPDLGPLQACGLAIAVADACADVRRASHYVTRARGGRGAVREVIELMLRCQERWEALRNRHEHAATQGRERNVVG